MKHDKELEDILGKENVKYNEPMKMHTSFKVGGNADRFLIIDSKEKLTKVLNLDLKNIYIIGNGTNILVRDKGIRGTVIKYVAKNYEINDNIIKIKLYSELEVKFINILSATSVYYKEFILPKSKDNIKIHKNALNRI